MSINLHEEEYTLKKHFDPDEKILWIGKPGTGIVFNTFDYFMVPFSIFWGGFAFFWEFMAITSGAPLMFALFGLPFVIVGFYLIFGRFYFDSRRRKHTLYALTDKRIFISTGNKNKTLSTVFLNTITNISLNEKLNGKGTINLSVDKSSSVLSSFKGVQLFGMPQALSFELIDDAADVYKKINNLINYKG